MKYSKHKSGDKESNSYWFHHCTRKNIPFVTISYRKKYADIEFDYITFSSKEYDNALRENGRKTYQMTFDLFERYKNPRTRVISTGWGVVRLENIEIEYSDRVAEELYDYVVDLISCKIDSDVDLDIN